MTISISEYRDLAFKLLVIASGGPNGRTESDPVYRLVTEERDVGAMQQKYSSCGDLPHWLYWTLGVRLPWVNRAEQPGGWKVGQNISALAWCPQAGDCADREDDYQTGDTVLIWRRSDTRDAHALVVVDQDGPILNTAEYGQPGAAAKRRSILGGETGLKKLQRVIPLEKVLLAAEAAGALVPIDGPGVLARLHAIDVRTESA